jgi:hypothetical protein
MTDDVLPARTPTGGAGGAAPPQPRDWSQPQPEAGPALEKELADARKEAAAYRQAQRGQLAEGLKKLAGVVGHEFDPASPPTIDQLIAQVGKLPEDLKAARDQVRSQTLRASLSEKFHELGLKPRITRAALIADGHMEKLAKAVDAADFDEQIETTLGELVESMPEVRDSGNHAVRTSAPMSPSSHSAMSQLTLEEIRRMPPEEVESARRAGHLNRLLGRP